MTKNTTEHPIYGCMYYIWEENLLTSYEDWIEYYTELEEKKENESTGH